MKKYFYFATALLTLASCTDNGFVGDQPTSGQGVISFNLQTPGQTRASLTGKEAATALNNQFIVWGEKNETSDGKAATDANMVLKNYVVKYTDNTANTTESNSTNWEYVGQQNSSYTSYVTGNIGSTPQTIKYWDFGASNYTFTAVSANPSDIASGRVTIAKVAEKTDGNKVYDKGYTVTVKSGASINDIYYSDRKVVTPNTSTTCVQLTFRNFMSKIRFGIYETIPGYKVSIDKVYYNSTNSEENFGVDGSFLTAGTNDMTFNVTYYDNTDASQENKVKVALSGSSTNTETYKEVTSSSILSATAIGKTSDQATKDDYVSTMPYPTNTTNMKLKVDYTLTSEDTGETIKVSGATAEVPSIYCQWQSNFAYTYLFKISDNTNGSTGSSTTGLYPMTFDAVVETDATTGTQETITSVSDPSITTYQSGVVVTTNNEYKAGTIYFSNNSKNVKDYKVYEVHNAGTIETNITEEVVANWKNNFVTLTEVTAADASVVVSGTHPTAGIPLSDGTYITTTTNQAKYFTAAAGKTYVIASGDASLDATTYKVVKVTGTEAAATYTLTKTTDQITTTTGAATYALTSNSPAENSKVLGADKVIKIYDAASDGNDVTSKFTISKNSTAGSYDIKLTDAAIAAGANGTYYVAFGSATRVALTVNLTYTLSSTTISATSGTESVTSVTLKVGETLTDGDVVNSDANKTAGITVAKTSTGTYSVTVAKTTAAGSYNLTIGGQTLAITVA